MNKSLASKMKIKSGHSILVINSPKGYLSKSFKADTHPKRAIQYDVIQLFINNKPQLDKFVLKAISALKKDGLFWVSYPKKSSGIKTDVTRDRGWEILTASGYEAISLISIDDTWSALRFRPQKNHVAKKSGALSNERKMFTATIEKPDGRMDYGYVSIPFNVPEVYGSKGLVKVKAWFDGYPYRGVLASMGTGSHVLMVRKDIRQAIGKNIGDKVKVELLQDTDERVAEVPTALKDALSSAPKAEKFFSTLSYTNKKEYATWISSAKKPETKERRLTATIQKLLQEKKNPSQK